MELDESAIVKGIRERDTESYEAMINQYSKVLYCLVYQILHGYMTKEDMEECVADVFVDAWYKIDKYNEKKSNFRTWLLMMTKYKALTYKRKKSKYKLSELLETSLIAKENVEKNYIDREEQEQIISTINGFHKVDKEIFFRRYFYGEKIKDLADKFQLTRSAIDNRLLRGRNKIKEAIGK